MYEKSMITTLTNVLYWIRELEEDAKHGIFVIAPATFITTWLHDLVVNRMAYEGLDKKDLDWAKVYMEAKERADKQWEAEHAKNNG